MLCCGYADAGQPGTEARPCLQVGKQGKAKGSRGGAVAVDELLVGEYVDKNRNRDKREKNNPLCSLLGFCALHFIIDQ
jgi:hypothetical protein